MMQRLSIAIFRRLAAILLLLGGGHAAAVAQATAPAWQSAAALSGLSNQYLGVSAFDGSGNLYLAQEFTGTTAAGGTSFVSRGLADVLVTKYTPGGTLVWAYQLGSAGGEQAYDLALDAQNNVYVTGIFSGNMSLGNNVSLTWNGQLNGQAYLLRLSAQGTPEWAQQSQEIATGTAVGVDANGQACWLGTFTNAGLTIGGSFLPGSSASSAYAVRLAAATGAVQALSRLYSFAPPGSGLISYPLPRLALAASGEAFVVTPFSNPSPVYPNFTPVCRGYEDLILAKYDAQNRFVWARQIGGSEREFTSGGAVDDAGNVYLLGGYGAPCTFGTATVLPHAGSTDGFLAKYSPQGALLWAQPMGGSGSDIWNGIALQGTSTVYVGGGFGGTVAFGAQSLTSSGPLDVAVAAYSAQGQLQWVQQAGSSLFDDARALGFGHNGTLYVRGRFMGSCAFGATTLSTTAASEIFVASLGSGALAASTVKATGSLSLYPVPTHDLLHLPALPAGTPVQLLDALGRVVRQVPVTAGAVSVQGLPAGLYQLRAPDPQGRPCTGRVVVE